MSKKYDAIVVGSGIGGLGAGLMLVHSGKTVLLLEKHKFIGGKLSSFDKQGFHYDFGVHCISRGNKGPTAEVFHRVGMESPIKFTTVRPVSSYKGEVKVFPRDFEGMVPDKDFKGLMAFLTDIVRMPDEDMKQYDHKELIKHLYEYTENDFIMGWVSNVSSIYIGAHISNASTGEFMRCLKWESMAQASGYPDGGCDAISNAYADAFKKFGGEIKTGAPVRKIEVENGVAKGVVVGDEVYRSDLIVSNADTKNTVINLVGADYFPPEYVEYVKGLEYTDIGHWTMVRIALDKELTDVKMLGIVQVGNTEDIIQQLEQGIVPNNLHSMLVVPSNFSDKICPKGMQYVVVGAGPRENPEQKARVWSDAMKETLLKGIFQTAEDLIPGIKNHILWYNTMTCEDMTRMFGEDAGIGIGQTVDQVGDLRPKIKSPVEGLYYVGGEAGGTGVGIELCLNSAMEFIDML